MQLNTDELYELLDKLTEIITQANRLNEIEIVLDKYNLRSIINPEELDRLAFDTRAKILIIGASQVNEDDILKLAKKCKINPDLIECEIDYEGFKHYNFGKLEYNTNYRCVLIGPIPHSVPNKGTYESIISKMENEIEKYPKIYKLQSKSDVLKITKTGLEEVFRQIS